jgi:peptidyl-prolyl cis-trans isomerase D
MMQDQVSSPPKNKKKAEMIKAKMKGSTLQAVATASGAAVQQALI